MPQRKKIVLPPTDMTHVTCGKSIGQCPACNLMLMRQDAGKVCPRCEQKLTKGA
jgi:hypothetical protein